MDRRKYTIDWAVTPVQQHPSCNNKVIIRLVSKFGQNGLVLINMMMPTRQAGRVAGVIFIIINLFAYGTL